MLRYWREKKRGGGGSKNTPTKTVLVSSYLTGFNAGWTISTETVLVPRPWHGCIKHWWKINLFPACFWWNLKGRNPYPHLHLGKSSVIPFCVLLHNLLLELKIGSQGFLGLFSLLCRLSGILNTHDPYWSFVEIALSDSSDVP